MIFSIVIKIAIALLLACLLMACVDNNKDGAQGTTGVADIDGVHGGYQNQI